MDTGKERKGKERKEKNIIYVYIRTIAAERNEIFNQSQSVTHTHTALAFYYIVYKNDLIH